MDIATFEEEFGRPIGSHLEVTTAEEMGVALEEAGVEELAIVPVDQL